MVTEEATEQVHGAAETAEQAFDPAGTIMHHISDAHEIEIPFTHSAIPLPEFHIGNLDFSITKHVVMMWIAGAILLVLFRMAARQTTQPVPHGLRNALEVLVVFIRNEVARKAIPQGADRFVGYLLTTFFFILTCNLLGLVPGMATATGNISVTAGLALLAFVMIQSSGVREYGLIQHLKNLVPHGLPFWLVPIMFAIELLSALIKPFALCIRLFANMMAGHVSILAFVTLIFIMAAKYSAAAGFAASPLAVAFALFVYLLEILIAFLQAYIFTMLTAQFIGAAVHPAH